VINRFAGTGIFLDSSGNTIEGNYIGTDPTGTIALGNGGGIFIRGHDNRIGGTASGSRNIISGNGGDGVLITIGGSSGGSRNLIQDNYIGTDITGIKRLGNGDNGVNCDNGPFVGSGNTVVRNIISANGAFGVGVGTNCTGSFVQDNYIGTDVTGTVPLGNAWTGVVLSASGTLISGNRIAFNGGAGAFPEPGVGVCCTRNTVLGNSIYSNADLGIDLNGYGVTPNDLGDADHLQNFPVITSATSVAGVTTIVGTLNSTPNTAFHLEFFANQTCDSSGFGEGESLLGVNDGVTTDATGNAAFTAIFNTTLSSGSWVTATATNLADTTNNTSEFSKCAEVNPLPAAVRTLTLAPATDTNPVGTTHTVTATVTDTPGGPVQGIDVHFDVTLANPTSDVCTTNTGGQCAFSYTGTNAGTDVIMSFADSDDDGVQDLTEPFAAATKIWEVPPPQAEPGFVTGGGQVAGSAGGRATFGFNANSNPTVKGECNVIDHSTDPRTQLKCTTVTSVLVVDLPTGGGQATITGSGTINGVVMTYRIITTDVAEPGAGSDSFTIQTTSGPSYTAGGTLLNGNVQIHR